MGLSQAHLSYLEVNGALTSVAMLRIVGRFFGLTPLQIGELVLNSSMEPPGRKRFRARKAKTQFSFAAA